MASDAKWTPGPWTYSPYHRAVIEEKRSMSGCSLTICEMPAYSPPAQAGQDANARLIAAAPEMLEALRDLTAWDDAREEGEPTDCEQLDDLTQRIEQARAIIRKATGEGD